MQARHQCSKCPELDNNGTGLNMAFIGCEDGASPHDRSKYSFGCYALNCLNLPPWLRNRLIATHILTLSPGAYVKSMLKYSIMHHNIKVITYRSSHPF